MIQEFIAVKHYASFVSGWWHLVRVIELQVIFRSNKIERG